MKRDWLVIPLLLLSFLLFVEAAGFPILLSLLHVITGWLRALPGPSDEWATILSAWAWPTAILLVAFWLRDHIAHGAGKLAERFGRDTLEFGNWLKITADTPVTTLDQHAATELPGDGEIDDVRIVEALLEYAGDSAEGAGRLMDWIAARAGPTLDPEEFLVQATFAELRRVAYSELVEG